MGARSIKKKPALPLDDLFNFGAPLDRKCGSGALISPGGVESATTYKQFKQVQRGRGMWPSGQVADSLIERADWIQIVIWAPLGSAWRQSTTKAAAAA